MVGKFQQALPKNRKGFHCTDFSCWVRSASEVVRGFFGCASVGVCFSGWWQRKYFLFSSLLGEIGSNLTNINMFQMGWFNHQPVFWGGEVSGGK